MSKIKAHRLGQLVELQNGARLFVAEIRLGDNCEPLYRLCAELDDPPGQWLGLYTDAVDHLKAVKK